MVNNEQFSDKFMLVKKLWTKKPFETILYFQINNEQRVSESLWKHNLFVLNFNNFLAIKLIFKSYSNKLDDLTSFFFKNLFSTNLRLFELILSYNVLKQDLSIFILFFPNYWEKYIPIKKSNTKWNNQIDISQIV